MKKINLIDIIGDIEIPESDLALLQQALTGESLSGSENFSPEINERLLTAGEDAHRAVASVQSPWPTVNRLIKAAESASSTSKRIFWLKKASDALLNAYQGVSACKSGCDHCCHIPVVITKAEARVLGLAIGRDPVPKTLTMR